MNAITEIASADFRPLKSRVDHYDWDAVASNLNSHGCAVLEGLLTADECKSMAALYSDDELFRAHIHMARHGFGKGEYKYFRYPLPALLHTLRPLLYSRVVTIANEWNARMKVALPQSGASPPDAASAAICDRRFQLFAPGLVRRTCIPVAVHDPIVPAWRRLYRRRVHPDRTAAAHAKPG